MKIYLIGDGKHIKIGISNNPCQRLKTLQTAQPVRLKLLFQWECKEARKIEKFLHRILWQFKSKFDGEWFLIDDIE
jgi:hypothetical protein